MKVLVTGGAGFIGSHVCDHLLAKGYEVLVIDDLSSGKVDNLDSRARFYQFDIRSPEAANLILREKPKVLFHLAAQMDVRRSVADPMFDADVNIGGLVRLLEAAAKVGTKRVIFSSTGGAIYGEQDEFPARENHKQNPCSPYGVSKASGELYLGYYWQQYQLPFVALRYANVYGPRQNPHGEAGVVAIFCERILNQRDCTIFGDGKQTRDFVYVQDVARANILALESDFVGAINIGTGMETDVNALYLQLAKASGTERSAVHAAAKPGEQRRSCIDPQLAQNILGWKPEIRISDGIAKTFRYFADRKS